MDSILQDNLKDIEEIHKLCKQANAMLTKQDPVEFLLILCRKIAEGMLIVISREREKSIFSLGHSELSELRFFISENYKGLQYIDNFFDILDGFIRLGTQSAHFGVNGVNTHHHKRSIKSGLKWATEWFFRFVNEHSKWRKTKSDENKPNKDVFFDEKNEPLPVCLKSLIIKNYQSIERIEITEIPVDSQFIVLTGDNGEGKTAILQAIAIGIVGNVDEESGLVLCKKKGVNIWAGIKSKNQTIFYEYDDFAYLFKKNKKNNSFIAYGASRLQLQSQESQDLKSLRQSNIYGIFKTDNILLNIEYWLKMQKLIGKTYRIQAVKELLIKLMPSISDIKLGIRNNGTDYSVTYIENNIELESHELSAGNKTILAMIGDMIIRLYKVQPDTIEPKELFGIVVIDELEAHLHPKWQKEFPKLLSDNFPLIQFIVSTHSPIVFLGMPKNSVFFSVSKDEDKKTIVRKLNIDIENILPNQILTSALFDMENIRNVHNKGIESLSVETEPEIKARKKEEALLKELSKGFKFQLPKE
jgi:predicted ATP-binding protein involved in virulence